MTMGVSIASMKTSLLVLGFALGFGAAAAVFVPALRAQDVPRTAADDQKRWQAVAPGRVEPRSGEIKISAPVVGRVGEVLVKPKDTVSAGELLIRLDDDEARSRLAGAEAQVAMRKRARNDKAASSRDRRRAEDAVADAEQAVVETRAAFDAAAAAKRAGSGSNANLESARTAYARAQDRLKQDRAELRRLNADGDVSLPTANEGQLNIARAEWATAEAAVEKLMVRAPITGTVLQVNAKAGELASPSSLLLVIGDVSALRVRAELDERDFADIKIGQAAVVRAPAFRGREVAGKVSAIAPIVDAGRSNLRGQRNLTDVNVVEVVVDLAEPGPLVVGMKVDVYFRLQSTARQ